MTTGFRRCYIPGLLIAWPDKAMVKAKEEERGWPLANEERPVVLTQQLKQGRDPNRAERKPVPRFFRNIVRCSKECFLRFFNLRP